VPRHTEPGSLSAATAETVLARLGFDAAPAPHVDGLTAVYGAWCAEVPFDNLRKRVHLASGSETPFPNLDPESFFADFLAHGAGGTCWPSTLALWSLLRRLGFAVRLGVASMYYDEPGDMESHGTVLADLDGVTYWVDTAMATLTPMPAAPGSEAGPVWRRARVERLGESITVRWSRTVFPVEMGCRLLDGAGTPARYAARYEASRGLSPFNTHVYSTRATAERVLTFAFGMRMEQDEDGFEHTDVLAPDERRRVLVEEFGYSERLVDELPPDAAPTDGAAGHDR
jgi:N-hydroxyarylamine O-acetyltransferase